MAQCQVTVTVTDENDHAPLITITNVATTQLDNGKSKNSVMSPLVGNAPKLTLTASSGPFFNTAQKCTLLSVRLYYDLEY